PADGAGEAGEERYAGDRVARRATVKPGDGGEGRFIEAEAHADADDGPGRRQPDDAGCLRQKGEAAGEGEIGRRQHIAAAVPVDHPARQWAEQARQQQRGREGAEEPRVRQVQLGRDRIGEDRRQVIGRAPGKRLRDAEGGDDERAMIPNGVPSHRRSYQSRLARTSRTTDSMTGTSTSTPTTVASAAPERKPKSAMAVATASSKKLLAPISAEGPATHQATPRRRLSQ